MPLPASFSPGQTLKAEHVNAIIDLIEVAQSLLDEITASSSANLNTFAEVEAALGGKSDTGHTHAVSALTDGGGFVRMTDAERAKLASLVANYKGSFASLAAVEAAYPSATAGDWAVISLAGEPASIAVWDSDATPAAWVDVDGAPPVSASAVPFTPAGSIAATNVQAAIEELDTEKQAALGFTPLNATAYTAADVLAKLLTVDGAGSGVDADMIDGVQAAVFARLDTEDMVLTGGVRVTSKSLTTGSITLDPGDRPLQYITNGGAFTITAPANDGSMILLVANNASAGAITFSGFQVGSSTGDALTTTNGHEFMISVVRINSFATYTIKALQ